MLADMDQLIRNNNELMTENEFLKHSNNPSIVEKIDGVLSENKKLKLAIENIFRDLSSMGPESVANQEIAEKFQKITSEIDRLNVFLKDKALDSEQNIQLGFSPGLEHAVSPKDMPHGELESLKFKILELENENRNLRKAAALPEATLETVNEIRREIQSFKKNLRQVRTEAETFENLEQKNIELQKEIAPATIQLTETLRELESLKKENVEVSDIKEKFEQAIANLKGRLDEKMRLSEELAEKNSSLEQSLNSLQSENQKLEGGMWELDYINKQLRKTVETTTQDIEGLDAQIKLRDDRIAALERDKRSLMMNNDRLTHEIVEIKASEDTSEGDLKQLVCRLSEELNELSSTFRIRDIQLRELQVQLNDQALLSAELAEAKLRMGQLEGENDSMNILLEEKNRELESLRKKADVTVDLEAEIQLLLDERLKVYEERDKLTRDTYERDVEIETLKLELAKLEEVRKAAESLQQLANEKDEQIQELTTNFEVLEGQDDRHSEALGRVVHEKAQLLQELERLIQENQRMQHDLDKFIPERNHLFKIIERKEADIAVMSSSLSILEKEYDQLKKDRSKELEELEELKTYVKHVNLEKNEMARNLEESDGRIAVMGLDLNKLEESLQGKFLEVQGLKDQLTSLSDENEELRRAAEEAQILNQTLQEQMIKESNLLEAFSNDKNSLVAQIEMLNQNCSELTAERESLLQKIHEREAQASMILETLNKLQNQLNLISTELDLERSKYASLESENVSLRSQLAAYQHENHTLQAQVRQLESLRYQLSELKSSFDTVSKQRDETFSLLNERDSRIEILSKEKDKLSETIHDRESQVSIMSETINGLQNQLNLASAELDLTKPKLSLLESGVFNLEDQIAIYEQENKALKNQIIQLEGLIDEHKKLKNLFEKTSKQRDEILSSLNERDSQIEALKKEIERLKNELSQKSNEFDSLFFECKEKSRAADKLQSELKNNGMQIGMLKSQLNETKAMQGNMLGILNGLNSERDELVSYLEELKQENNSLTLERDKVLQITTERDFQIADMARTLKAMQEEIQYQSSDREQSRKISSSFEIMVQKLTSERDLLSQQNETFKQNLTDLSVEKNRLVSQIEQKDLQLSDLPKLQEDINRLVLELDKYSEQVVILGDQAKDLANQLFDKKQESSQLEARISELENLKNELFDLRRQFNEVMTERDGLLRSQNDKEETITSLKITIDYLNNTLQVKSSETESLLPSIDKLEIVRIERDSLLRSQNDQKNTIETSDTIIDFFKNVVQAKGVHLDHSIRSVSSLESQLEKLKRELELRNKMIEDLSSRKYEVKTKEYSLTTEFENFRAERDQLTSALQQRDSKIRSLEHENNRLLRLITSLKHERDEIKEALNPRDAELKNLKRIMKEASLELEILRGELSAYELQDEKLLILNQDKEEKIDSLKERIRELVESEYKMQTLAEENKQLRQWIDQYSHLSVEYAHLQQNIGVITKERDELLYSLRESRNDSEKLKPLGLIYKSVRECLESSERELFRLGNEVAQRDEYIKELEVIRERFESLSHMYKRLSDLQEVVTQENMELKQKCEDLEVKNAELHKFHGIFEGASKQSTNLKGSVVLDIADIGKEKGLEFQGEDPRQKEIGSESFHKKQIPETQFSSERAPQRF